MAHLWGVQGCGFSDLRFFLLLWPIPTCPFFARCLSRREEKPAPFTIGMKSAAPENSTPKHGPTALARVPAHSNARGVNYGQEQPFVALMYGDASIAKPALIIPRAFGADLGGRLNAAPPAKYTRRLIPGQQLYGGFRRALRTKGNNL